MLTVGGLFSGIGGIELGLQRAGFEHVWMCEVDHWCQSVLRANFGGEVEIYGDVRKLGAATALRRPDVLAGGFPCQDVSSAGKGEGLEGARSGLWYHFRDIVAELRPAAVIVENVASGKAKWLAQIRRGLEALGYRTRALRIRACDVGAPHLRARIFVIAVADAGGQGRPGQTLPGSAGEGRSATGQPGDGGRQLVAHGERGRCRECDGLRAGESEPDRGDVPDASGEGREGAGPAGAPGRSGARVGAGGTGPGDGEGARGSLGYPDGQGCGNAGDAGSEGRSGACWPGAAGTLPDPDRDGLRDQRGRPEAGPSAAEHRAAFARAAQLRDRWRALLDPDGQQRRGGEKHGLRQTGMELGADPGRSDRDQLEAGPQPGMGGTPDGISAGLDGPAGDPALSPGRLIRWRWPAGRGKEQHAWEAPRLIPRPARFSNRRPRLKGLGNAVVPQCAFLVALALIDWMADLADLAE